MDAAHAELSNVRSQLFFHPRARATLLGPRGARAHYYVTKQGAGERPSAVGLLGGTKVRLCMRGSEGAQSLRA